MNITPPFLRFPELLSGGKKDDKTFDKEDLEEKVKRLEKGLNSLTDKVSNIDLTSDDVTEIFNSYINTINGYEEKSNRIRNTLGPRNTDFR